MNCFKEISNPFDTFIKTRKIGRIPFVIKWLCPDILDNVINVSTEINNPKYHTKVSDCLIETETAFYIAEFQKGHAKKEDIYRFYHYHALVVDNDSYDVKNNKPVYIIIIYIDEIDKIPILKNGSVTVKFYIFSLKDYNADEHLQKIENKIKNKQPLNKKEKQILEYIPLLKSEKTEKELLEKTIKLVSKDKNLTDKEKQSIGKGQLLLALGFSKTEEEFNKWVDTMAEKDILDLVKEMQKERFIKEGIIQGKEEGILSVAKRMLKNNFSINDIIKNTKLSRKQIEQLQLK